MSPITPLLGAGLGWVVGVALQLQQAALWPLALYGLLLGLGCLLLLLVWRLPAAQAWPLLLVAGVLSGAGLTGSRAAVYAAHALPSTLEGRDISVIGRIASLPQTTTQGQRFGLAVESATLDGQTVALPDRLQLSWFGGERSGGMQPLR